MSPSPAPPIVSRRTSSTPETDLRPGGRANSLLAMARNSAPLHMFFPFLHAAKIGQRETGRYHDRNAHCKRATASQHIPVRRHLQHLLGHLLGTRSAVAV
jgi:hypothetical protein